MTPDPFTQTVDALWQALEASARVTDAVTLANRIKRTGDAADATARTRPPEDRNDGDLPTLDIIPSGGLVTIAATSQGIECQQNFELSVGAASARLDRAFFPLLWSIVVAIVSFNENSGGNLGLPFVANVALRNYTNDENAQAILQGLSGMSSLLTVEVSYRFKRREIAGLS